MEGIIVGVDGSEESLRALRWAHEHAASTGERLTAVHAYRMHPRRGGSSGTYPTLRAPYLPAEVGVQVLERQAEWAEEDQRHARSQAEAILDRAISEVAPGAEGRAIERHVVERDPARALVELSNRARLLVVGHRGKGGFGGLRLGSVALKCAHHAHCPVLVVR